MKTQQDVGIRLDVTAGIMVDPQKVDRLTDRFQIAGTHKWFQLGKNPRWVRARQKRAEKTVIPKVVVPFRHCSRGLRAIDRHAPVEVKRSA